jgi:integrase
MTVTIIRKKLPTAQAEGLLPPTTNVTVTPDPASDAVAPMIIPAEQVAQRVMQCQATVANASRARSPYEAIAEALNLNPDISPPARNCRAQRTLQDIVDRFGKDADLTKTRRRDAISAISRLASMAGLSPADIPATADAVRDILKHLNPAKFGLSERSFTNVVGLLNWTLRQHRPRRYAQPARGEPLPADWAALIESCHSQRLTFGLRRLFRFFAAQNWRPFEVGPDHFDAFLAMLREDTLLTNPERYANSIAVLWRRAADTVPGWPMQVLSPRRKRPGYTRRLGEFPMSFQLDFKNFANSKREIDIANPAPQRILRPNSIRQIEKNIRQIASALVAQGIPIEEITDLSFLVRPDIAKLAMRFFLARNGKKPSAHSGLLAIQLVSLAKQWCQCDPETFPKTLEKLMIIRSHCLLRQRGMTEKNQSRLVNFNDENVIRRFLSLPTMLASLAAKTAQPPQAAFLMRMAVSTAILIQCPIRIANLAAIETNRHLVRSTSGRVGKVHLVIPGHEVKNLVDLDFELHPALVRLIDSFRKNYRHLFSSSPSNFLFPSKRGSSVSCGVLGQGISQVTKKYVGVEINPHLFRHIAAKLYLDRNPGDYETIRRVLGHTSLSTTVKFYAGMETGAATRRYDEAILSYRARARATTTIRGRARHGER